MFMFMLKLGMVHWPLVLQTTMSVFHEPRPHGERLTEQLPQPQLEQSPAQEQVAQLLNSPVSRNPSPQNAHCPSRC